MAKVEIPAQMPLWPVVAMDVGTAGGPEPRVLGSRSFLSRAVFTDVFGAPFECSARVTGHSESGPKGRKTALSFTTRSSAGVASGIRESNTSGRTDEGCGVSQIGRV